MLILIMTMSLPLATVACEVVLIGKLVRPMGVTVTSDERFDRQALGLLYSHAVQQACHLLSSTEAVTCQTARTHPGSRHASLRVLHTRHKGPVQTVAGRSAFFLQCV